MGDATADQLKTVQEKIDHARDKLAEIKAAGQEFSQPQGADARDAHQGAAAFARAGRATDRAQQEHNGNGGGLRGVWDLEGLDDPRVRAVFEEISASGAPFNRLPLGEAVSGRALVRELGSVAKADVVVRSAARRGNFAGIVEQPCRPLSTPCKRARNSGLAVRCPMAETGTGRPMGYEYDIFISYRRDLETRAWIKKHFSPLLTVRVRQELTREPVIYIDEKLESGVSWPEQLGIELGKSRILIALWAKDYFASPWCTAEAAQMLARAEATGRATAALPRGLVVFAVIHGADAFPDALGRYQRFKIEKGFSLRMGRNSRTAQRLDKKLAAEAPAIAKAIEEAPPWRRSWPQTAAERFREQFSIDRPQQTHPPR